MKLSDFRVGISSKTGEVLFEAGRIGVSASEIGEVISKALAGALAVEDVRLSDIPSVEVFMDTGRTVEAFVKSAKLMLALRGGRVLTIPGNVELPAGTVLAFHRLLMELRR